MGLPLALSPSFPLILLSFLCTAALLNILHLIALQTGAFYSGLYLHGKYFAVQAGSSRQAGSQLSHLSTSLYSHPLHLSASGAVLLTAVVVFGLAVFVYICCLALPRSICCFWNIFNKTLYAFHFCNNCAALSSGI